MMTPLLSPFHEGYLAFDHYTRGLEEMSHTSLQPPLPVKLAFPYLYCFGTRGPNGMDSASSEGGDHC